VFGEGVMGCRSWGILACAALAAALLPAGSRAQSPLPFVVAGPGGRIDSPPAAAAAEPPLLDPTAGTRMGNGLPPPVACYARPSDTGSYCGYYVGGGCATRRGEAREAWEGTWGWDYLGCLFRRRIYLQWWHGRRYQGGTRGYRIDGPRLLAPGKHNHECDP
jgi:hypothetical protein